MIEIFKTNELFAHFLTDEEITGWVREYEFFPTRNWKVDFAFIEIKLAIEIEGGVFSGGRHVRGVGFTDDCVKYNELTMLGWRLLRFTSGHVDSGYALWMTCRALALEPPPLLKLEFEGIDD
jgi:very-short-patch-repair endonuclease